MSYSLGLEVCYETSWKPGGIATTTRAGLGSAAPRLSARRGRGAGGRRPAQRPTLEGCGPRARCEGSARPAGSWPTSQVGRPVPEGAEAGLAEGGSGGRLSDGPVDLSPRCQTDSVALKLLQGRGVQLA